MVVTSDTKWRLERDESWRWPQSLMKPAISLDASSDVVCALVFALFIVLCPCDGLLVLL